MANFFRGNSLLRNNDFIDPSKLPKDQDKALYEVLRVIDYVPIFWKEHFNRLFHSAELAEVSLTFNQQQFASNLKKIIQKTEFSNGNLRILVTNKNENQYYYFYFVPHGYPCENDYRYGVKLGVLEAERLQPQAKIIQQKLRSKANQLILKNDFHEVLLTNNRGEITEGSRSNVFFVKGNTFITPPLSQVLKGITRTKVIECLCQMNYEIKETIVSLTDLKQFDSAFLTGTSPKVLPVSQIDKITFNPNNQYVNKLMVHFDKMIDIEIAENRSLFCS